MWLERVEQIRSERLKDTNRLCALHASEVECIGKGLVVGARSFPGNPYDGGTLEDQLEQVGIISGCKPTTAIVDLDYRSREIAGVTVLHRGKAKRLTRLQWT